MTNGLATLIAAESASPYSLCAFASSNAANLNPCHPSNLHRRDFDVPLDVCKVADQSVDDQPCGSAADDLPDNMIGLFLVIEKIHFPFPSLGPTMPCRRFAIFVENLLNQRPDHANGFTDGGFDR